MTIVFINGSFGIGKTSATRMLQRRMGGRIYDPEFAGRVLRMVPHWLHLTNQESDDYQDMPVWRNLTVTGIRATRSINRLVLVPMAFSNRAYLAEIIDKVRRFDDDVRHFCLVAPFAIVEARLRQRNDTAQSLAWTLRRARECCEAHQSDDFSVKLDASLAEPKEIAALIAGRVSASS